jgi:Iap family predicted aminopeptidase
MKEIPGYKHIQKLSSPGKKIKMEISRCLKNVEHAWSVHVHPAVLLNWIDAEAILECLKQKASGVLLKK